MIKASDNTKHSQMWSHLCSDTGHSHQHSLERDVFITRGLHEAPPQSDPIKTLGQSTCTSMSQPAQPHEIKLNPTSQPYFFFEVFAGGDTSNDKRFAGETTARFFASAPSCPDDDDELVDAGGNSFLTSSQW
jgi:hypothetical protein